jgi:DsbC/DsbD-like thiol-disulfide interchange protein
VSSPKGPFYGIPYPGTYIIDTKGIVVEKYFEEDYSQRYTAAAILTKQFGAPAGEAHSTIEAKHLKLSVSAAPSVVHTGQRIVLAADIDLPPGTHVYAPGVQGYIPIDLSIVASDAIVPHPAVYPPSKILHLKVINEKVPVYTNQVRIIREVTIGKNAKPGDLTINGTFRYQACDDKECFIPETVPVRWALHVEALDRQRAPAEMQRK